MSFTASKLYIARRCLGAFALPHLDEQTAGSEAGKERHSEWEDAINAGDVPEELTSRWPEMTWRAEVKFAYDVETGMGRELGVGSDRDYSSAGPNEIPGTADVIGESPDLIVVVDRKGFNDDVERAEVNAQVHIAALALCRAKGKGRAVVAIRHEVRPFDVAERDSFDLDAFAVEARNLFRNAAAMREAASDGHQLDFTPGDHCRWCPAFHSCPKQQALTTQVTTGAADVMVEMLLPLGDDVAFQQAYEFSQRLGMLKKRLDAAIYAEAAKRPRSIGNGMMMGKVSSLGNEKLDGDIAYEVILAMYGHEAADAAVTRQATKKRIKDALTFTVAKGAVAEVERKVLAAIRAKGGAKREMKESIDTYPAHELKAGATAVLKAANE